MLGDTTGFSGGDVGMLNGIEQRSLAVVNVTHDHNNRASGLKVFLGFGFFFGKQLFFDGHHNFVFGGNAEFIGKQVRRIEIDHFVGTDLIHAESHAEKLFDNFAGGNL